VLRRELDIQRAQLVTAGVSENVLRLFDQVRDAAIATEHAATRTAIAGQREAEALERKARLEARLGPSDVNIFGGPGSTSLLGGFRDIEALTRDIGIFRAEIERLAKAGIPASDLFAEIAKRQDAVNDTTARLKDQYATVPTIFNELVKLERQYGNNDFQRALDRQVRSLQGLAEGGFRVEDGLRTAMLPAVLDVQAALEASEGHFNDLDIRVVILTGDMYELARAFNAARLNAILLNAAVAGQGQVAVAPPGNF